MRRLLLLSAILLCGSLCCGSAYSQESARVDSVAQDSALRISLLTCSPGHAIYELYGHTAIRLQDHQKHLDVVFNYGVFDFNQPYFIWRFMLGRCDYILYPYAYPLFCAEYKARGSSITEQELNLLPEEAEEMRQALWEDCAPERRVYRYNIFRSNCTTKARDMIEAHVFGHVIYPVRPRRNTFRTILHQFTGDHVWDAEGNDLLLGADVDTLLTERDEMFSPIYLMWYMDSAIVDRGYHRFDPLVRERRIILAEDSDRLQQAAEREPSFPLSPVVVWWGLLVCGLLFELWEVRRRRVVWQVDAVLLILQGVAGLLLTFMALFSIHPGVASNWQVWVLNPLPLFFVVPVVRAARGGRPCIYHRFAAFVLLLFVAMYFFIPQDFSTLILPLALLLLSRELVHLYIERIAN